LRVEAKALSNAARQSYGSAATSGSVVLLNGAFGVGKSADSTIGCPAVATNETAHAIVDELLAFVGGVNA